MLPPAEFLGLARDFRTRIAIEHPRVIAMIDRIGLPLHGQSAQRQCPSPSGLARVAEQWRTMPATGRLSLAIKLSRVRLLITEVRASPAGFRFESWLDGVHEPGLLLTRRLLVMSARGFVSDETLLAEVSLHALARRYQRGFNNADTAVRADLFALAMAGPDVLDSAGEFAVPAGDGRWAGVVTELEDRGHPAHLLAVRTFRSDDMPVRVAELAMEAEQAEQVEQV